MGLSSGNDGHENDKKNLNTNRVLFFFPLLCFTERRLTVVATICIIEYEEYIIMAEK